ncbi:MAG TPA: CPBP family intramembrane glutamic endopeptidase [Gallionella sp.]|nr:CPBP family intramembrane glutamic endopeptidase [Gallionella sp.]
MLQLVVIAVQAFMLNPHLSEAQLTAFMKSSGENGYILSVTTLVTTLVCCSLIVGIIKLKKGSVLADYLRLRTVPPKVMARWAGYLVGMMILSDLLTMLLGRPIVPDVMLAMYATADPAWLFWLALVIAAPLFEETFFRGFLFRGLESSFIGPVCTIFTTAALWAVIHVQYDAYGVATVFVMGLLFGAARAVTGSLLVPLGLHALTNLASTIEAALLVQRFHA